MSNVDELDGAALRELLGNESRAVLVDFWSPWCGPCRALRPHLDKLAEERAESWRFVAVNTDKHEDVGEEFAVSSLPTLIAFQDGRELTRLLGGVTLGAVVETLDEFGDGRHLKLEA